MNRLSTSILLLALLLGTGAFAQAPPPAQKTLAATLKVHVYPNQGQRPEQQSADEAKCYKWAVDNTGIDPVEVQKQAEAGAQQAAAQQAAAQQAGKGSRAGGALIGGATGALIGEIASNDAGKGAAIGAAVGVVAGGARRRHARREAEEQAQATAAGVQAVTEEQLTDFRKSFAVCLEAKGYLAKF
jgi:hypothetical protein